MTMGFSSYSNIQINARDAKRKSDLKELKTVLYQYHSDKNAYPDDGGSLCGCLTSSNTSWILQLIPDYADSLPIDPLNVGIGATAYFYTYIPDADQQGFELNAILEKDGSTHVVRD